MTYVAPQDSNEARIRVCIATCSERHIRVADKVCDPLQIQKFSSGQSLEGLAILQACSEAGRTGQYEQEEHVALHAHL